MCVPSGAFPGTQVTKMKSPGKYSRHCRLKTTPQTAIPNVDTAAQYSPYYSKKIIIITSHPDMSWITFFLSCIKLIKTGNKAYWRHRRKNFQNRLKCKRSLWEKTEDAFFFFKFQNYAGQNSGEEEMRIRGWNGNQRQGKHRTFKALCISWGQGWAK